MLESYFEGYITVAVFAGVGALIVGAGLFVSKLIRPNNPNLMKSQAYECGIDPVGFGWSRGSARSFGSRRPLRTTCPRGSSGRA